MEWVSDVVFNAIQKLGAPDMYSTATVTLFADRPPMPLMTFRDAAFASARRDEHGRQMPQAIAHRGFKARYPENTMAAFEAAVRGGAHAIETDVHLTKDNMVVLCHDSSLRRCFGINKKVIQCTWSEIKHLRTLDALQQPMPTLEELLQYMTSSEARKVWLMLDIKTDNEPENVMSLIAQTIARVNANGRDGMTAGEKPVRWENRIVLGCWAAKFFPLCDKYLPGFAACNIGFSIPYSQQFLAHPNISLSMRIASLIGPFGRFFVQRVKERKQRLYSWTVNHEKTMDWCIRQELDGVISDDPVKFLRVCEDFQEHEKPRWPLLQLLVMAQFTLFSTIFSFILWQRHGFGLPKGTSKSKKTT